MEDERILVNRDDPMAQVEYVDGAYSSRCISINDTRVTTGKLWGCGYSVSSCHVDKDVLRKLIEGKESVKILAVNYGHRGFWVDGVNISTKGTKEDYDAQMKRIECLRKKCSKAYHPKLLKELYEIEAFKVDTEDIEEALNNSYYYLEDR